VTQVKRSNVLIRRFQKEDIKVMLERENRMPYHKFTFRPEFIQANTHRPFCTISMTVDFLVKFKGPVGFMSEDLLFEVEGGSKRVEYKSHWSLMIERMMVKPTLKCDVDSGYYQCITQSTLFDRTPPESLEHLGEKRSQEYRLSVEMFRKVHLDLDFEAREFLKEDGSNKPDLHSEPYACFDTDPKLAKPLEEITQTIRGTYRTMKDKMDLVEFQTTIAWLQHNHQLCLEGQAELQEA